MKNRYKCCCCNTTPNDTNDLILIEGKKICKTCIAIALELLELELAALAMPESHLTLN